MKEKKLQLKIGLIVGVTAAILIIGKIGSDGEQVETYTPSTFKSPAKIEVLPDRISYTWESPAVVGDSLIIEEVKNDTL